MDITHEPHPTEVRLVCDNRVSMPESPLQDPEESILNLTEEKSPEDERVAALMAHTI